MVTMLEPRVEPEPKLDLAVETAPLPENAHPRVEKLEMRYAMPFAGVRYYSFQPRPAGSPSYTKPAEPAPVQLAAQLIDERVILL